MMSDMSTESHSPHSILDHSYIPSIGYSSDALVTNDTYAELKKLYTRNIIKYCDMTVELTNESLDIIISGLDKYRHNYELCSKQIKELMDKKFTPNWHCIIGEGYGFNITNQLQHCIHVYYQGNVSVLLFKC